MTFANGNQSKTSRKMDGWYHNAIFYNGFERWHFILSVSISLHLSVSLCLSLVKMNNTFIESNYFCMQAFSIYI